MDFNNENSSIAIGRIIARSISGTITTAEQATLDEWLQDDRHRAIYESVRNGQSVSEKLLEFDAFGVDGGYRRFRASINRERKIRYRQRYAAVAAVLLFLGISLVIYRMAQEERASTLFTAVVANDIEPGGSKAMLTLADGRVISLDSAQSGIVVGNEQITYQDGTQLVLSAFDKISNLPIDTLTLSTPRGGQYQVTLPDGSEVWLNAASTLRYPSQFGGDERIVELSGEGYFVVTEDKTRPFRVLSAGQVVEVLGTEFNISAYDDEAETRTTLAAGSVRLNANGATVKLVPGEQAIANNGKLETIQVDVAAVAAWKSGRFVFDGKPFSQIMNEMARWYDLEVQYEGRKPSGQLVGDAFRNQNLSIVLGILDVLEINYELDAVNRRLTIHGSKGG